MSRICDADCALVLAGSFQFSFEIGHAADHQWERRSQSSPRQQSLETLHVVASPSSIPPRRGRFVPKEQLQERFPMFERGDWLQLLRMSQDVSARSADRSFRSRRRDREEEVRASRALFGSHGRIVCSQAGP